MPRSKKKEVFIVIGTCEKRKRIAKVIFQCATVLGIYLPKRFDVYSVGWDDFVRMVDRKVLKIEKIYDISSSVFIKSQYPPKDKAVILLNDQAILALKVDQKVFLVQEYAQGQSLGHISGVQLFDCTRICQDQ